MAFFQVLTDGVLLDPVNITNLILQNSYIVIMALGMLLVIVGGNIDLSVGSIVGFVGAVAAILMVQFKVHYVPVIVLSLLLGAAIGGAAGLFRRLQQDPVLYRHAGGHADLPGPDRQHAAGTVRRTLPAAVPGHQCGLHPRRLRR